MRIEVYRDELKMESIEVTIQQEKLRLLGHVARMGEEGGKGKGEGREKRGWKK